MTVPTNQRLQLVGQHQALSASVEAELHTVHLDAAGIAKRYGLDVRSIYNMRTRGVELPPSFLIGGRPRWRLSDVIVWESQHLENR